ncbi:DUF4129 domain-containing protein [Pseudonocardia humida]|uniref:DUF4129 domain-containing protein n=1 Tax=Pseudonocardia humida TaxID=2800819 RepID=A0ABT0ZXW1_9PSEU|nr:DUF4129 domain-containing protein [Pseudonocardia humida]MCO1655585.1 DUF4129 domain-containing protein [Pseudonocardia humida]
MSAVPPPLGRDEAREAAARELSDPVYAADDPAWPGRVARWLVERLDDLLSAAASAAPGGYGGLLVLGALVVLAVVAVRLGLGRIGRSGPARPALLEPGERSADDHRRAADAHAARGEWVGAVRERVRGIVRGLEERDLLEPSPGRTADEAAAQAARVLPDRAADLRAAARLFDEVCYGDRPAGPDADARLREVDDAVRRSRPAAPAVGA